MIPEREPSELTPHHSGRGSDLAGGSRARAFAQTVRNAAEPGADHLLRASVSSVELADTYPGGERGPLSRAVITPAR
jgi:hypothetical protein